MAEGGGLCRAGTIVMGSAVLCGACQAPQVRDTCTDNFPERKLVRSHMREQSDGQVSGA
jgi:hypothetical protein